MTIVINAINLSSAGGLNVTHNFLKHLPHLINKEDQIYVYAPENCGYEKFESDQIRIILLSLKKTRHINRFYTDNFWLPREVKKVSPDVIFSMGNFAMPIKLKSCKQALLFHWPYAIYPDADEVWRRLSWKDRLNRKLRVKIFKRRLRFVDAVFPQTHIAKERLEKYYPFGFGISVIPNAYTNIHQEKENIREEGKFFSKQKGYKYLMYLSRYYPHKNLEVLVDVAKEIRERNLPFRLIFTADESQHPNVKKINQNIKDEKLENILNNIGSVKLEDVPSLYEKVEGVLFPTLLESFSALYVDAMVFQKPMFTSNIDFAKEICEESAFYFDPLSAIKIVDTLEEAFASPHLIEEKLSRGKNIIKKYPNWEEVAGMYYSEIKKLKKK